VPIEMYRTDYRARWDINIVRTTWHWQNSHFDRDSFRAGSCDQEI